MYYLNKMEIIRYLLTTVIVCISLSAFGMRNYITTFYEEVSITDAERKGFDKKVNERYFIKTNITPGAYKVTIECIGDFIDSTFYSIEDTNYFIDFRIPPFLRSSQQGILRVDYIDNSGLVNIGEFIKIE